MIDIIELFERLHAYGSYLFLSRNVKKVFAIITSIAALHDFELSLFHRLALLAK